jgi:hypothetical protein
MTWLGLVTTITLVSGLLGASILTYLATSLRLQHATTTKQTWNRRMLGLGGSALGAAVILPFLLEKPTVGLAFGLGWIGLGVLVGATFSPRRPTRVLGVLLFLTLALATLIRLPPHRAAFYGLSLFVVAGLLLALVTRITIARSESRTGFDWA